MGQTVEIGSSGAAITFACAYRLPTGAAEYLDVTLRGTDLEASRAVYDGYFDGFKSLARFFDGLAASWRGWSGERAYESIESDLRIVATHDGHVRLRVRLWQSTDLDGWSVESSVTIDAGEQLSQAAKDVSAMVRS